MDDGRNDEDGEKLGDVMAAMLRDRVSNDFATGEQVPTCPVITSHDE